MESRQLLALVVAEALVVDLDARDATAGTATWTNDAPAATSAGDFTETLGDPVVGMFGPMNNPAVDFDGNDDVYQSTLDAPAGLVGADPTRSIEVWVWNPAPAVAEETMVSWGHRGGPNGSNLSFNYGDNGGFGAVGHWGGADIGWNGQPTLGEWHHLVYTYDGDTTRVYSDGLLKNSETLGAGAINTHAGTRITLAAQLDNGAGAITGGLKGQLALANVRVHDGVLSDADVINNYNEDAARFGKTALVAAASPVPMHRYSFNDGTANDSIGAAHGALINGATVAGGVLELNNDGANTDAATGQYATLPIGSSIEILTDATFEAWFEFDGGNNWQRLFDVGNNTANFSYLSPQSGFGDAQSAVETRLAGVNNVLTASPLPTDNSTIHAAVVVDATNNQLRYYLNGRLAASSNDLGGFTPSALGFTTNNWLGRSQFGDPFFNGSIDEFRIYDTALTDGMVYGDFVAGPDTAAMPTTPAGIEVAGILLVDLDARDPSAGTATWTNNGTLGDFQEADNDPVLNNVGPTGVPAVVFDGDDVYQSNVNAPAGLTGQDPTRTIEVWVYNDSYAAEETMVSWGRRGGPNGSNLSFGYGENATFGALGQWGAGPDVGWNGAPQAKQWHHLVYTYDGNEARVYDNGQLKNSEVLGGQINTHADFPILLAAQHDAAGNLEPANRGTLALSRVRVHDGVLNDTQIQTNYDAEKADFGHVTTANNDMFATAADNVLSVPGQLVAGDLLVDLDARDASAAGTTWTNNGILGDFSEAGGDAVLSNLGPSNNPAVTFDGTVYYQGSEEPPADVVAHDPRRSIETWVYNPTLAAEETMVAWGRRGGPNGSNVSFNYGSSGAFGAVGHWGGADIGFDGGVPAAAEWHHIVYTYDGTSTAIYVDGQLNATEDLGAGAINTHFDTEMLIAAQWANATTVEAGLRGTLSLGNVRVHSGILSGEQVSALYNLDAGRYGKTPGAAALFAPSALTANDIGAFAAPVDLTAIDATSTQGASISVATDGTFTYDPTGSAALTALSQGQTVTDTFTYTIADQDSNSDSATVNVIVTGVNDAPTAADITDTTDEDAGTFTADLAAATTDPDTADTITFTASQNVPGSDRDLGGAFTLTDGDLSFDTNLFNDLSIGVTETVVFNYTANDGAGQPNSTESGTVTITVEGRNDQPTAGAVTDTTNEDAGMFMVNLLAATSDPDTTDTLTIASATQDVPDSDRDLTGAFTLSGGQLSFDTNLFNDLAVGETETIVFNYTVDDGAGQPNSTATNTVTITVEGRNDAPVAGVDASFSIDEGSDFTFTGIAADPDSSDTLTFDWDLDGDGSFGDASVANPTFNYDNGPASIAVSVRVSDGTATDTATTTVTVNNVAPSVNIAAVTMGLTNTPVAFTLTSTDPSTADEAGSFEYDIDWGDGMQMVTGPATEVVNHTYSSAGTFTVRVTSTDEDSGLSAVATHVIEIENPTAVVQVGDDIIVTGTSASDRIVFSSSGGGFRVRFNDEFYPLGGGAFSVNAGTRLIVNANEGSDTVVVHGTIGAPAVFDGGEGNDYLAGGTDNDTLNGGTGNDIILGGEGDNILNGQDGNDRLEGRSGIDFIFGGTGNDRLNGGAANDILDGGSGTDSLFGGLDDDLLHGGDGSDTINGYAGNDVVYGGEGADQLFGGLGNDLLFGGLGADRLRGDSGDDVLVGGTSGLEADTESSLADLWAGGSLMTNVQAALDAWFASQSVASRMLYEPFTDDGTADDLTGSTGANTFQTGSNDRLRDVRSGDIVL